jgi:hypothetical protein
MEQMYNNKTTDFGIIYLYAAGYAAMPTVSYKK